jgi:prophage regulatory protein
MQKTNTLPQTGFIRLPQVLQLYPVSKSTLWLRVKEGRFPSPVKLSERVTAWKVEDVQAFITAAGVV